MKHVQDLRNAVAVNRKSGKQNREVEWYVDKSIN